MVCGSAILQILGIRPAQDIDLLVSPELFIELKEKRGWKTHPNYQTTIDSPNHDAGAKQTMDFMKQNYTLADILPTAYWYEDIPFMNLEMLIDAKTQLNREKDILDLNLIQKYLAR